MYFKYILNYCNFFNKFFLLFILSLKNKNFCYFKINTILKKIHRLTVKTSGFGPEDTGSIPIGSAKIIYNKIFME